MPDGLRDQAAVIRKHMELSIGEKWNGWTVEKILGQGSFGKVYHIVKEEYGNRFESALKVISIPQNESELESVRSQGLDEDSARSYYMSLVSDISNECALMYRLRGNSSIVSYEGHSVVEATDRFGWDIFIRMELLTPLVEYMHDHTFSETDILHLGTDICRALDACSKYNIIHRDIKPENVFVTRTGRFKLGDFGIARKMEETSGMSRKGTLNYMAPEMLRGEKYNQTVDIYSLGIMLYRLSNSNRAPFLPPYPERVTYADKKKAYERRLTGEPLPPPCNAGNELSDIILKACAFHPADRYQTAAEMLDAVLALAGDDDSYDSGSSEPVQEGSIPAAHVISPPSGSQMPSGNQMQPAGSRKRSGSIAAAAVCLAALVFIGVWASGGSQDNSLADVDWYGSVSDFSNAILDAARSTPSLLEALDANDPNLAPASSDIVYPEYNGDTITVSTSDELFEAINTAKSGTIIKIKPGTYDLGDQYLWTGGFKLEGAGSERPVLRTQLVLNCSGVMFENLILEADDSVITEDVNECTPLFLQDLGPGWTYLKNTDLKVSGSFGDRNTWGLCADGRVCLENCSIDADNNYEDSFVAGAFFTQYVRAKGCTFKSTGYAYDLNTNDTRNVNDSMIESLRKNNTFDAPEECFEIIIDSNFVW